MFLESKFVSSASLCTATIEFYGIVLLLLNSLTNLNESLSFWYMLNLIEHPLFA